MCLKAGMNASWVLSENDRILKYTKRHDKKSTNKKPKLNIESCVQNVTPPSSGSPRPTESFNAMNSKPLDASGSSSISYQVNTNSSFFDMPSVDLDEATGDLQQVPSNAFPGVQPNVIHSITQSVDLLDSNLDFCKILHLFNDQTVSALVIKVYTNESSCV